MLGCLMPTMQVVTSFPKFDDVIIAEQDTIQGRTLNEQYRSIIDATLELLTTDKLKQELAVKQKVQSWIYFSYVTYQGR